MLDTGSCDVKAGRLWTVTRRKSLYAGPVS
jgi:hypothetical protein